MTLRKDADLHSTSFRSSFYFLFNSSEFNVMHIHSYTGTFVNNWNCECKENTFQSSPWIGGGSKRTVRWWLNSHTPASSLWLANRKKLVKTPFLCCQANIYIANTISAGLLSSFIKEAHQEFFFFFLYALVYMLLNCNGTLRVSFCLAQWSPSSWISLFHMCLICQTIIGKNQKPYSPHAKIIIIMCSLQSIPMACTLSMDFVLHNSKQTNWICFNQFCFHRL